jgi:DNA-binding transcriptional regulator YdaS (Cro superfamily)
LNKILRLKIVEIYGTQEKFAAAIGRQEAVVSKWVRGIRQPNAHDKGMVARALDCKEKDLWGNTST